jgi:hypothetical protein
VAVTQGTVYWLAVIGKDTGARQNKYDASCTQSYRSETYITFTFPDPAGSGFTSQAYYDLLAGWGTSVQTLIPSTIASVETIPAPTIINLLLQISPGTIGSTESIPNPLVVLFFQIVLPSSIASAVAFGNPVVGYIGLLAPGSIASAENVLSPTVVRFVYHGILDGRFSQVSPAVNRVYVVGRDQYGNPVFGSCSDSDGISLVGERLDFQQELSVPTDSLAADVAAAMIAKRRLTECSGFIIVPPNCGQELWDVIWINDAPTAQDARLYRVTGILLEYSLRGTKPRLTHRLTLGAR